MQDATTASFVKDDEYLKNNKSAQIPRRSQPGLLKSPFKLFLVCVNLDKV